MQCLLRRCRRYFTKSQWKFLIFVRIWMCNLTCPSPTIHGNMIINSSILILIVVKNYSPNPWSDFQTGKQTNIRQYVPLISEVLNRFSCCFFDDITGYNTHLKAISRYIRYRFNLCQGKIYGSYCASTFSHS